MALTKCRECGDKVSTGAIKCPHCGVKNPALSTHLTNIIAALGVIVICIFLFVYISKGCDALFESSAPKAAPKEIKFGLSESERRQIWHEMIVAEDRATQEGEAMYPVTVQNANRELLEKQTEEIMVRVEKCRDELARKYGLTRQQLTRIVAEATMNDWPMPPLPD